jgi:beta-galactosidase
MTTRHAPIAPSTPHMLHGGDYNPDQWRATPEVWDDDIRLLREAHGNCVSLGIFAWTALEPEEGRFDFGWMDQVVAKLERARIVINFATPGGARPAWMAQRYPEVLRVDAYGRRQKWGGRHNHCLTSPVFRARCAVINRRLAERYQHYPYWGVWHVNNEYSGECHCDLCQEAFRGFLRERYGGDLDRLNRAWWTGFWSHTLTDWSQIEPPSPIGERETPALKLDWQRFCTYQTIACFRDEAAPLREVTPHIPVTTNYMTAFSELDYAKLADELDVISWDSYPEYHDRETDAEYATHISFIHEQRRAMKNRPFLLMECAPSATNWRPVGKLKRPGVHLLEGLQAVAHGADSVLYFQVRKGRGGFEKFHGAIIDHYPVDHTRVFREVQRLGAVLGRLDGVVGAMPTVEAAVIYDYENRWAIDAAAGPRNIGKNYIETCYAHYGPFWRSGVPVDVVHADAALDRYRLVVAPMLYLIKPGVAERLERFVRGGGTLVTTYLTGIANETDLCFQTGFPGPLRALCGVWAEETDALHDDESVPVVPVAGNALGLSGTFTARQYCDVVHAESAEVLATYGGEFYAGQPALTVNRVGEGRVYHVASRNDAAFHDAFTAALLRELRLERALGDTPLPPRVTATWRGDGAERHVFVLSFNRDPVSIPLSPGRFRELVNDTTVEGTLSLPGYGAAVLIAE